jgi:multisubunit Na+/H+ antiporter MnhB subunit
MTEYPQKVSESWSERMRLIRFRRKREKGLRFWQEFRLVPAWLRWTVAILYVLALAIAIFINRHPELTDGQSFPPELSHNPGLADLALMGIVTCVSVFLASYIFMIAYVNRDSKRRGMSSGLWTFLVIVLSPAYFAIGFILYFLMRQPLPYACPQCDKVVGARFNYCPNCKCNLHPSCPQCKQEVAEDDKYCPNCACDLRATHPVEPANPALPAIES